MDRGEVMTKISVEVKPGQIWQRNEYLNGERLPNQGFVRIVEVLPNGAVMEACTEDGLMVPRANSTKPIRTTALLRRFGKRGGYILHEEVK
jgi:hypothetical protein